MSDRDRPEIPSDPPESHAPEEALLLTEWAASLEAADEIPEEVLGFLDGSLEEADAARVRQRLADDPALAKAAGDFLASLRTTAQHALGREAPGRLLAEAADQVPRETVPHPRPGLLAQLADRLGVTWGPGLAAAAAAAVLVTFVFVQRERAPAPEDVLRSSGLPTSAIALESPAPDARVTGPLEMTWQPVPGAVRYRVVLVDADGGAVIDAGNTDEGRLSASAELLAGRLGESETRTLHWIVRARLLDGSEVSSEPRRVTWSAH